MKRGKPVGHYFEVTIRENANGIEDNYYLRIVRPDIDGYEDRIVSNFLSGEELNELRSKITIALANPIRVETDD